jgi:predicted metal-dependent peptidase
MHQNKNRLERVDDPRRKLDLAILRIKALTEMRLFGACLCQFGVILHPANSKECLADTAYIKYDVQQRRFDINFPENFFKDRMVGHVIYIILHEMLHVLHKHPSRGRFKRLDVWNLAGDHVINFALNDDVNSGRLTLPKIPEDTFLIKHFVNKNEKVTVEEAYAYLLDNAKVKPLKVQCPSCGGSGKSSKKQSGNDNNQNQKGNKDNQKNAKSSNSKGNKKNQQGKNNNPCPTCGGSGGTEDIGSLVEFHDPNTGQRQIVNMDIKYPKGVSSKEVDDQSDKFSDQLRSDMRVARDIFNLGKSRGIGTGSVAEMLDDLLKVDIPIEVLLSRAVATKLRPSESSRSWTSLNRIYQSLGLFSPGRGLEENIHTGICVKDTSMSISTDELKIAGGAILACAPMFEDMYVLSHDHILTDEQYYENSIDDESAITEDLKSQKGRGGTSHKEVFDRIEELYEEHNGLGIVIMITDYYSDVTELFDSNDYEWCKYVPISILLTPNESLDSIPQHIDPNPIQLKHSTESI